MAFDFVSLDVREPVATLRMWRPPDNLLHMAMLDELNQALSSLRGNERLEVLVLRGREEVFSDGLDLREHDRDRVQRLLQVYSRIFETIRMTDVVSIAAVQGRARGAGFELALGCDLIVAAEGTRFGLPEIDRGILPPIACIVLPRVAPRRRAMEWILTGREIPAGELERFGLLNRIFSPDRFDAELDDFVQAIAGKSGPVLKLAKQAQYEAYYATYEEALYKVQNLYLRELMELEDAEEGLRAYVERRLPVWKNR